MVMILSVINEVIKIHLNFAYKLSNLTNNNIIYYQDNSAELIVTVHGYTKGYRGIIVTIHII